MRTSTKLHPTPSVITQINIDYFRYMIKKTNTSECVKKIVTKSKVQYDLIANEYYHESHKTCRLFDILNDEALKRWSIEIDKKSNYHNVMEIGCGLSKISEKIFRENVTLHFTDISLNMLKNSINKHGMDRNYFISSSFEMPIQNRKFDLLFSFLTDPYNCLDFYKEAHRILRWEGILFGTIPSYEWSKCIRANYINRHVAKFRLKNDYEIEIPSIIDKANNIEKKLRLAGFENVKIDNIYIPKSIASEKIPLKLRNKIDNDLFELPILYSYLAVKK